MGFAKMPELYIFHDENGKYVGEHYDIAPPAGWQPYAAGFRKLSYDEINSTHYEFKKYVYNEPELRKMKEIHLGVSTEIFEIDGVTKLSIFLKATHESTPEEITELEDKIIEIKLNGQVMNIPFGEILLLNPEHPGIYTVELSDSRFYSRRNKYTINVIDEIIEE